MIHTVTIIDNLTGKRVECPVKTGTHGQPVVDCQALAKELGMFIFDPAFMTTASCESAITFIDGEKGLLLYRGYPIEQLAEHCSYLEVCHLLLYGDLPTQLELDRLSHSLKNRAWLNEGLLRFYHGFRYDAHPMSIMVGVVGAMSSYYHDALDINNPEHRDITARRLLAKMPTIAALAFRHNLGKPYMYPDPEQGYVENFLRMMFAMPNERYMADSVTTKALEIMMILHADHEQNASTSTVRLAGSSQANPYACIAAGISTLWGPAHGGANEAVVRMLQEIGQPENIPAYLDKVKDRDSKTRLMGFGHRVYKNYDPRAAIIRDICHKLLNQLDHNAKLQPLLDTAMALEQLALEDSYFQERRLYPNVDFYSGIILRALGLPLNMFTVMFAVARTAGWIAQWQEMMSEPNLRIGRPRQLYVGPPQRSFTSMDQRTAQP